MKQDSRNKTAFTIYVILLAFSAFELIQYVSMLKYYPSLALVFIHLVTIIIDAVIPASLALSARKNKTDQNKKSTQTVLYIACAIIPPLFFRRTVGNIVLALIRIVLFVFARHGQMQAPAAEELEAAGGKANKENYKKLMEYKKLLEQGVLTEAEYEDLVKKMAE